MRVLADNGFTSHADPLFSRLEIVKLEDILKLNASIFMYKFMNSKLPASFDGMFNVYPINRAK